MDLSTTYLGLKLAHPLIPGSSPLTMELDGIKRLEDAGAPAIVMHSLFEEQIVGDQIRIRETVDVHEGTSAEASSFLPSPEEFRLGPEEYLELVGKAKKAVRVPVIASLNGTTPGGWLDYAKKLEQAGADALELNTYDVAADPKDTPQAIEQRIIEMARSIKKLARIPVAVKLSPFYTSIANFAKKLDEADIDGLVLFNRFYQPDIDVENLEVTRSLELSNSSELLLRLRALAILSGKVQASLAATGGVHTALDAVKAVMCGAHAVQMVSAILKNGPGVLKKTRLELASWMEKHEYESLRQMQGSMSLTKCPNPKGYERGQYIHILKGWRGER
jgi:dihydroorotate dehydrogenase (fumarate)